MESVDTAFRLGFEQGAVQSQQDQAMQQQQQSQEMEQAQAGGIGQGNGAEGSQPGAEQMANPNGGAVGADMSPDSENPGGSELDQHIAKLESMLKSETVPSPADLMLLTGKIQGLRKAMIQATEMKKSQMAIPAIAKALHKPSFKLGVQASHNMNSSAKQAVGMQEKIVTDIMKSWADEEKRATSDIQKLLNSEILAKKE